MKGELLVGYFSGSKDFHVQDLKRHEKLDGVLGVNLGTGLSAGGGLSLHQELIMTMPGKYTITMFNFLRTRIIFLFLNFKYNLPSLNSKVKSYLK